MSTTEQARAFWITGRRQSEIREETLPEPGRDDVVVRTLYSAISRGTESLVYNGEVPESEHERMRAPFQAGDFPGPVKYGYNNVGVVERGPPELEGREVFCLYPHQTRYVVPAAAVEPLPDKLPARRAVLAANMQTAINALWDARIAVGDRVAVVGAGTVGCLVAFLAARVPGCRVELVDADPARAEIAERLGAAFKRPPDATRDADLVVHASGSGDGLNTALELAGFEATVLELSWFGARAVELGLGGAFHSRRLKLVASQVAHVATPQRGRWDHARRNRLALELLAERALEGLVAKESRFEELPEVMARLSRSPAGTLCHRINYA